MKKCVWSIVAVAILGLASCDQKSSGHTTNSSDAKRSTGSSSPYQKGACFDKVISPYVYQIAQVEGSKIFYFAIGKSEKQVLSASVEKLFKGDDPFRVIDCP